MSPTDPTVVAFLLAELRKLEEQLLRTGLTFEQKRIISGMRRIRFCIWMLLVDEEAYE